MSEQITKKDYTQSRSLTKPDMCEYGCCNPPATYFPTTDKWCCSQNAKRCPANKAKSKQTVQLKYGVDNISQLLSVKQQKIDTCMGNYGTNHPAQSPVVRTRTETTNVLKYGVKNVSQNADINSKRNKTFATRYNGHPLADATLIIRRKNTMLEKYGVDNFGKTPEHTAMITHYNETLPEETRTHITEKILKTKFDKGIITDPALKSEFETYYNAVRNLSDRNYKKHKTLINPCNFCRGRTSYHLDHIFSIKEAYENNVSVEVVSHVSNLRMLKYDKNIAKGGLSDKSLSELFEDFYKERA
jgi:hypothetical protein